jgi:hypothetical protein
MNSNWFLVLSAHGDNSYQLAYASREHAEAVAKVKTIEYPAVGPYRVIELAEVVTQPEALAA